MKYVWVGLGIFVVVVGSIWAGARRHVGVSSQDAPKNGLRTPVVVELFTSEGCSSCPPADAFLAKLDKQQPVPGAEVIALEEHVDYWDQQGWRDPFSSPDWTERQRTYAQAFGSGGIYTPQMIVNGSTEFVGSRERSGKNAIEEAARRSTIPVTLTASAEPGKNTVEVSVQVEQAEGSKLADGAEVWLAITETGLHSAVSRGENAGEDLYHAAVVRKLQKLGPATGKRGLDDGKTPTLTAKVSLDSGWKRQNLQVVAFVQERRSLRIVGAARAALAE